jgi:ricin-type beta-trefoil lectin protein
MSALAVAGTLISASPAHAETIRQYENNHFGGCMDAGGNGQRQARSIGCNAGNYQKWRVQTIAQNETPQEMVYLRNVASDYCLDSNGTGSLDVMLKSCNGGRTQRWEVFLVGARRVFKSWDRWKTSGTHKCIWEDGTWTGQPLELPTCTSTGAQLWNVV